MAKGVTGHRLDKAHHLGYAVEDIESTVTRLAEQFGAGPFFHFENVPLEEMRSRGGPAEFAHNSAFGICGGGPIELMEIIRLEPTSFADSFRATPPALHHVAYTVASDEVSELREELVEGGLDEYFSASLGEVNLSFHSAHDTLGHDVEVHVDCGELRQLFEMVAREAEGWDGSQPLRAGVA